MQNILHYLSSIWENIYLKGFAIYGIYVIVVYFILAPICKYIFLKVIKKTNTNLDNEIYGRTRNYLKMLLILFGLNLIYKTYFISILNNNFVILYNIVLTIEIIVLYIIIHRTISILLKYTVRNFSDVFSKNMSNIVKIISEILIVSVFVLLALKVWGVNITPLLASAGIFGLAVAMASKSIIENFLSGMILFADKTVNVGDTIILSDGTSATVEEINIRTTQLKTFDGNVVIIPNSDLLNERIINKSLSEISPQKRVMVTIGISYGDDTEKSKELVKEYLTELEGADKESVVVYVDTLADWSVNVTGKIMVDADKRSYLLEKQILEKAYKEFPKNGLNFPFPTYSIEKI